jgi:hypothetical protein
MGERREGVKDTKGIKGMNKESEGLRYKINHSLLNLNGIFTLVC